MKPTHTHEFEGSSLLAKAEWYAANPPARRETTLVIHFHSGGQYTYLAVPEEVHHKLVRAESPGKFFGQHIRGFYSVLR